MFKKIICCTLLISAFLSFISCGKEQTTSSSEREEETPRIDPEVDKQKFYCERGYCPSYIANIMVLSDRSRKFCTGTLVSNNTIVTSTSCLPKSLRASGVDCSKDVFFFFTGISGGSPQIANCRQVLQISNLTAGGPLLWRNDVTFLELSKPVNRRPLSISREGMSDERDLDLVTVDQLDDFTSVIRASSCRPVFNSHVNPLSNNISSPNVLMAGCSIKAGATGSPLLDSRGRIRGIVSQPLDENYRQYLLSTGMVLADPLKSFLHATNFACAPTIFDHYQLDDRECSKSLSGDDLNRLRKSQLEPEVLFKETLLELRRKISGNDYIEFGVRAIPQEKHFSVEVYPLCFKNVSIWLRFLRSQKNKKFEVSFDEALLKKMLDANGMLRTHKTELQRKKVQVYFSPKNLHAMSASDVTLVDAVGFTQYNDLRKCESLF